MTEDKDIENAETPTVKLTWTKPHVTEASINDHTAAAAATTDDGASNLLS